MADERDLLSVIIGGLQYDFCEDDEEVQGTWDIRYHGDKLMITYIPFDDSPYPSDTMTYQIKRIR